MSVRRHYGSFAGTAGLLLQADEAAVLLGYQIEPLACGEVAGNDRCAPSFREAAGLIGQLLRQLLMGGFWFEFFCQLQVRLTVAKALNLTVSPK